ncbi:MAG: type II toxin-antitoxin system HicA family toxin [Firmicutes bacterium]|nr:type II toxin-antitoxin system HicA family toxin [[Eubacterium] siraeum]MCM1487154.1 type II toxin-antitoxin system HicA family toxin [Bacillota bacterium]
MTFNSLEKLLRSNGWEYEYTRGSHHYYKHPTRKGKITVPKHQGDIPIGTVNFILKQAGIK